MPEPVTPVLEDSVPPATPPPVSPPPSDTPPATPPPPESKPGETPPAPPAGDTPPAPPAEELFELPDGRKVDAATLAKEFKENFLPEFTRKSQELSRLTGTPPIKNEGDGVPDWKKPDYVPQTYAEMIEIATKNAMEAIKGESAAETARVKAITDAVEAQFTEVKKIDPSVNENELYNHAMKYEFKDLKAAHANLVEMKNIQKTTEATVIANLKARGIDPVAGGSGVPAADTGAVDMGTVSSFRSATEYLAHLQGKK